MCVTWAVRGRLCVAGGVRTNETAQVWCPPLTNATQRPILVPATQGGTDHDTDTSDGTRCAAAQGVLPLHLASVAEMVTEVPLALAPEDRGRELDLARLREVAGAPRTYVVREIEWPRILTLR
jgi:hypothetical protein